MLKDAYPYYLAGRPVRAEAQLPVTNKYTGEVATRVAKADASVIDEAIAAAVDAFDACRTMPAYARTAVPNHLVARMSERREEIAHALAVEAGKPIRDARGEVTRAIDTVRIAAEEATRIYGEVHAARISRLARTVTKRSVNACRSVPVHSFRRSTFP